MDVQRTMILTCCHGFVDMFSVISCQAVFAEVRPSHWVEDVEDRLNLKIRNQY
jgi:hypothetical protein